jgi:gluconate 2-dehydrogenase gamma chain
MVDEMGLTFFTLDEAAMIEALASRIIPGSTDDPGAREAGVVTYIDRALSGAYARWQRAYREGIHALNVHTMLAYGDSFHRLPETDQDAVLGSLERGEAPNFPEAGDFFFMVWTHTNEGMFSDPAYGGNRDLVGWKLIGFPGAQYGYSAEEMRYGADISGKHVMTLADIQRLAREQPHLFYRRPEPHPPSPTPEIPGPVEAKPGTLGGS